jgi:hypothetical protein
MTKIPNLLRKCKGKPNGEDNVMVKAWIVLEELDASYILYVLRMSY